MSHPWRSRGTIVGHYEPQEEVPHGHAEHIRYAIGVAYEMAIYITIGYLRQLH
ncbi:MAG: hypothetical protein QXH66_04470 [Conexivisphaerales archaeon]